MGLYEHVCLPGSVCVCVSVFIGLSQGGVSMCVYVLKGFVDKIAPAWQI